MVGGGDSALETAIALASAGAHVTLSYRKKEFARPKPENVEKLRMLEKNPSAPVAVEKPTSERVTTSTGDFMEAAGHHPPGSVRLALGTQVVRIEPRQRHPQGRVPDGSSTCRTTSSSRCSAGRRRSTSSGAPGFRSAASGSRRRTRLSRRFFSSASSSTTGRRTEPSTTTSRNTGSSRTTSAKPADPATFAGTVAISARDPGFYYSLAYCLAILLFGIRRIRVRKTPYVTRADRDADRDPARAALPAPVHRPAVARAQRRLRLRFRKDVRRQPLPLRRLRPRARVLARLRLHPGVAALHLERLLAEAARVVARRSRSSRPSSSSR